MSSVPPMPAKEPAADRSLPLQLKLSDDTTLHTALDALLLRRFVSGEQPHARSVSLQQVRPEASLLPEDATVLYSTRDDDRSTVLAQGEGYTVEAERWKRGAEVTVVAVDDDLAERVLARATTGAEHEPDPQPEDVEMGFWYLSSRRGPYRTKRRISAGRWDEIRPNYSAPVAESIDRLMKVTPDDITGRLLLLHGPPGTGKTSALRTLARSWQDWCRMDCVLDPERLFNEPGYLMDITIGEEEGGGGKWRLLLLEDCDELIRGEAKHATGQALSRLLNLTDGLLGQGRNVLVGITTNEALERLHPAVVRPGRCLARIEVGALTRAEAIDWLGEDRAAVRSLGPSGATLAELFALRRGGPDMPPARVEAADGLYL